jgi:dipeptidyl aminopeptidase/acylaminoacyl peptidase
LIAIAFLQHVPLVNPSKVGLYGNSRGAIVASMVATKDPPLAAVVLGAGAYNFFSWYPTPLRGIDANIEREPGTSAEAFRARSAMYHADKIRVPVLLLHGAQDARVPVQQWDALAEKLAANGSDVKLKNCPNTRHGMPINAQYHEIYPFLEQPLG